MTAKGTWNPSVRRKSSLLCPGLVEGTVFSPPNAVWSMEGCASVLGVKRKQLGGWSVLHPLADSAVLAAAFQNWAASGAGDISVASSALCLSTFQSPVCREMENRRAEDAFPKACSEADAGLEISSWCCGCMRNSSMWCLGSSEAAVGFCPQLQSLRFPCWNQSLGLVLFCADLPEHLSPVVDLGLELPISNLLA